MRAQVKFPGKWVQLVILTTFNGSLILGNAQVFAEPIPLTQATLRKVVNRVDLFLLSQLARSAKVNDRLSNSGDAIKTQRASRTELKFNDGTLAKVGELATFRFIPNTRRFELGNGTYLFLVPPGRGNTEFNTPNAKAGIKGSALFIRYIEESDTTIMGALTNNPLGPMDITVGGKKQDLYAGQMVVAIKDRIDRVETFDLTTFFQTSPMYRDIDIMDPDLQAVRQEMADAVTTQVAAIGTLPARVVNTSKPGILSAPTSNVSKRELSEARENLNNPSRHQPIVQPAPPNVVEPPIVQPAPPNVVEPPIVKPNLPNIVKPPIVKPSPPNIVEPPIVKPLPPNVVEPPIITLPPAVPPISPPAIPPITSPAIPPINPPIKPPIISPAVPPITSLPPNPPITPPAVPPIISLPPNPPITPPTVPPIISLPPNPPITPPAVPPIISLPPNPPITLPPAVPPINPPINSPITSPTIQPITPLPTNPSVTPLRTPTTTSSAISPAVTPLTSTAP